MKKMWKNLCCITTIMFLTFTSVFAKPSPTVNGSVISYSGVDDGYAIEFEYDQSQFEDVKSKPMGQIEQLNSGTNLVKALEGEKIEGVDHLSLGDYTLLTKVQDLKPFKISNDERKVFYHVTVTWEVPNLTDEMDIKVLHYSTHRQVWEVYQPDQYGDKKVTNTFQDLSPVAIIYKLKETPAASSNQTKTGDETHIVMHLCFALGSLTVLVILFVLVKKKKDKR